MVHQPPESIYKFDLSPAAAAERLRKEARGAPAGVKRDQLLRRALQIEAAETVRGWSATPQPKAPE